MAQTMKIQAVGKQTKPWNGKYGGMVDYKVKFEDSDNVVTLTRKADSKAPVAGEEVYGTVDMSGEYGPKFKSESKPFGGGGASKTYQPKDEKAIQAMWAIGQAIAAEQREPQDIEALASDLFAMVDRIKTGSKGDTVNTDVPDEVTVEDIFGDVEIVDDEEIL